MKQLILVRHAKTEQLYTSNKRDFDRELLERGITDAQTIVLQLKQHGINPQLFVSSPAKRALQTAHVFATNLSYSKENIQTHMFIYKGYTTAEMLSFISQLDDSIESVVIFGHNPDIANLTVRLSDDNIWHFPTCCATVINFDNEKWAQLEPRSGKVILYTYPKALR